jgi:hypothetical protein
MLFLFDESSRPGLRILREDRAASTRRQPTALPGLAPHILEGRMQIVHPFRLQDRSAATGSSGDHHSSVLEYEVIDLKGADDFRMPSGRQDPGAYEQTQKKKAPRLQSWGLQCLTDRFDDWMDSIRSHWSIRRDEVPCGA